MRKGKKLYVMLMSTVCCSLMLGTLLPIFAEDLQENKLNEVDEQLSNEDNENQSSEINADELNRENDLQNIDESIKEPEVEKKVQTYSSSGIGEEIWDGSSDTAWYTGDKTVYQISTAKELSGLADLANGGNRFTNITIQLMSDIYLNEDANPTNRAWKMIGTTYPNTFDGTIDGNGHKVHNVYVNSTDSWIGFIQYSGGETPVKNLTISGSITGNDSVAMVGYVGTKISIYNCHNEANIKSKGSAAGIVASMTNGNIINCTNSGTIEGKSTTGGIIGYDGNDLTIKDCQNTGNVSGGYDTGGIVGKAAKLSSIENCTNNANIYALGTSCGGIIGTSYGNITNCKNLGGKVDAYWGKTGGIVGFLDTEGSIKNCENSATIISDSAMHSSAGNNGGSGGIIGSADKIKTVEKCQNNGTIEAKMENGGGIIGSLTNSSDNQTIIKECKNSGNVGTANSHHNGGIVGYGFYIDIMDSQNSGIVKAWAVSGGIVGFAAYTVNIQNTHNSGDVIGVADTGGIVGYSFQAAQNGKLSLTSCKNTGVISSRRYLGGIVGRSNGDDRYTDCINEGNIVETLTPDGEDQYNNQKMAGGIVGYTMTNTTIIDGCKNIGTITGDGNWMGGIVGSNVAEIKNCVNTGSLNISEISSLNDTAYMQIGGIVGWNKANVTKCINEGTINVIGKADAHLTDSVYVNYNIGGISGNHSTGKMLDCQNKGSITIKNDSAKLMTYHVGGVSGYLGGVIEDSSNIGDIKLTQGTMSITNKSQVPELGGIAGQSYTGAHVEFCYNLGHLTSNAETTVMAGLVADAYYTSILNSYHVGTIESQCTTSNLFINGIVHFFQSDGTYKIENVYAAGKVITVPSEKVRKNDEVYGISGNAMNPEYIHNAYYDINVMGAVKSVVPDYGDGSWDKDTVKGLSTLEMTGKDALNNMKFSSFKENWIVPDDHIEKDNNYRYYPLLKRSVDETSQNPIGIKYLRVTFDALSEDITFNVVDGFEKTGVVAIDGDYQFIVQLPTIYNPAQLVVKDNDVMITAIDSSKGLYEIKNIDKDHHITLSIQKIRPTVTFPTKATMSYGQTLKDATYYGYEGDGTFHFKELDKKLSVKESGKAYTMVFTPNNTNKFESIEQDVIVYVEPIHTTIPDTIYLDYQENIILKDVKLPGGWSWNELNQSVQIGEHKYLASYHDQEGNYKDMADVFIKVIMKDKGEKPELPYNPDVIVPNEPHNPEIIIPNLPNDSNNESSNINGTQNELSENQNQVITNDKTNIILLFILLSLSGTIIGIAYKKKK